jgi:hypothetical protein
MTSAHPRPWNPTRASLEFTVVLIEEPPGEVCGIAAVLRDVTERWHREKAIDIIGFTQS